MKILSDKILLNDKDDVLRIYIRAVLMKREIKHYDHDIDVIIELYNRGGYSNSAEQKEFIKACISKGYRKSDQSVRNILTQYTNLNIFKKRKWLSLCVSEEFLPPITAGKLILELLISHQN